MIIVPPHFRVCSKCEADENVIHDCYWVLIRHYHKHVNTRALADLEHIIYCLPMKEDWILGTALPSGYG